jgi:hypothetical protein
MPAEGYSLQANSFFDALLKISVRFLVPMGVEWVKSPDSLKPVQFARTHTTAADVIRAVVSMHAGYERAAGRLALSMCFSGIWRGTAGIR